MRLSWGTWDFRGHYNWLYALSSVFPMIRKKERLPDPLWVINGLCSPEDIASPFWPLASSSINFIHSFCTCYLVPSTHKAKCQVLELQKGPQQGPGTSPAFSELWGLCPLHRHHSSPRCCPVWFGGAEGVQCQQGDAVSSASLVSGTGNGQEMSLPFLSPIYIPHNIEQNKTRTRDLYKFTRYSITWHLIHNHTGTKDISNSPSN